MVVMGFAGWAIVAVSPALRAQVAELDEALFLGPLFTTAKERRALDQARNNPPPAVVAPPQAPPPPQPAAASVPDSPPEPPPEPVPEPPPEAPPEPISIAVNGLVLREDGRHAVWLNGVLLAVGEINADGVWTEIDESADQPQLYLFWEANTAGVAIKPGQRFDERYGEAVEIKD